MGYSSDGGYGWTEIVSGTTENLNGVDVGNAQYIAVGDNETIVVGSITSTLLEVAVTDGLFAADTAAAVWHANTETTEALEVVDSTGDKYYEWLTETALFTNAGSGAGWAVHALGIDIAQFNDRVVDSNEIVRNTINISSEANRALGFSVVEALEFSDDILSQYGITLLEVIEIGHSLGHNREVTAAEAIAFNDIAKLSWLKTVLENVTLDDALVDLYRVVDALEESFSVTEVGTGVALGIVTLDESFTFDDTLDVSAVFNALITEGVAFGISLINDGEILDAWVVNADHHGMTRYEGYNFSSMASSSFGDFGINAEGVYELEGAQMMGRTLMPL